MGFSTGRNWTFHSVDNGNALMTIGSVLWTLLCSLRLPVLPAIKSWSTWCQWTTLKSVFNILSPEDTPHQKAAFLPFGVTSGCGDKLQTIRRLGLRAFQLMLTGPLELERAWDIWPVLMCYHFLRTSTFSSVATDTTFMHSGSPLSAEWKVLLFPGACLSCKLLCLWLILGYVVLPVPD